MCTEQCGIVQGAGLVSVRLVLGQNLHGANIVVPIGGTKQFGIGRQSGVEAAKDYLETKSVMISIALGVLTNPI